MRQRYFAVFAFLAIVLAFVAPPRAQAATRTWTGAGGSALWSAAANWDTGTPQNGDSLVFPSTMTQTFVINDLTNLVVESLQIGFPILIEGNAFHLGAGGMQVTRDGDVTFNTPITLDADQTWSGSGTFLDGEFIAPATLALNGRTLTFNLPAGMDVTVGVPISGPGVITQSGANMVTLSADNTLVNQLIVHHGILAIGGHTAVPATVDTDGLLWLFGGGTVGDVSVSGSATLRINDSTHQPMGTAASLAMNGGILDLGAISQAGNQTLSKLTVTGGVSLNNTGLTMVVPTEPIMPALGTLYTIIDQGGSAPVGGTFAGLPEGAYITFGPLTFQISYVGGTGNDVVLKVVGVSVPGSYLLSEGATSSFFTTEILLASAVTEGDTNYTLTFLKEDGSTVTQTGTVPQATHRTIRVNDIPGMAGASFSTQITTENQVPLIVERTMSWDATGYGAHTEHAVDAAATTWYFAEGSQGFFHTYLSLVNPNPAANTATVQYLREGDVPLTRTYPMTPTSRLTIDAGADPELVNRSFGMVVTFAQPGSAERSMYFGSSPLFNGGHESAGVNFPSSVWFLAEGATGPFFETFILLANPGNVDAQVTMRYLPAGGTPVTTIKSVPAHGRLSVNVEQEDPALANAAVATQVTSTQPLIVERSQYWPDPAPNWYEAHNAFGVPALGTHWGLAEGRVGGSTNAQTYILLANPGPIATTVDIRFIRESTTADPITREFVVAPNGRLNVRVAGPGSDVPELANENFGAYISSTQPIAVERSLYWDANSQIWAAGTNATAMRVP